MLFLFFKFARDWKIYTRYRVSRRAKTHTRNCVHIIKLLRLHTCASGLAFFNYFLTVVALLRDHVLPHAAGTSEP